MFNIYCLFEFHLIRSKKWAINDFELTGPNLYMFLFVICTLSRIEIVFTVYYFLFLVTVDLILLAVASCQSYEINGMPVNLSAIPSTVTSGRVLVSDSSFPDGAIPAGQLQHLENVHTIEFSSDQIKTIETNAWLGLNHLLNLNLPDNLLEEVDREMFEHLTSLETLVLSSNIITTLCEGSFEYLPNIEWIRLNGNRITRINAGVFNSLPRLRELYFYSNRINSISNGAFWNLTSLQYLTLQSNDLQTLSINMFLDPHSLGTLVFLKVF